MLIQEEDTIPNWLENDSFWGEDGPEGHDRLMRLVEKGGEAAEYEKLERLHQQIDRQLRSFYETAYRFTIAATSEYREHPFIVEDALAVKVSPNLLSENSRIEIDLSSLTSLFEGARNGESQREWSYAFSPESSVQEGHFWVAFYDEENGGAKEKLDRLDAHSVPVSGIDQIVNDVRGEKVSVSVYPLGEGNGAIEETTTIK
ncbi:hypothetical protein [Salinibacter sp. 10B]|uniref:hypothetical protein n=1 Tax=Salinibacter sp. 10B TaxID=1923971 RepID=UPI0011B07E97|nr:hypothetical protein [Salinibacter sp. 10B]